MRPSRSQSTLSEICVLSKTFLIGLKIARLSRARVRSGLRLPGCLIRDIRTEWRLLRIRALAIVLTLRRSSLELPQRKTDQ